MIFRTFWHEWGHALSLARAPGARSGGPSSSVSRCVTTGPAEPFGMTRFCQRCTRCCEGIVQIDFHQVRG
jgi:hypothetical protein